MKLKPKLFDFIIFSLVIAVSVYLIFFSLKRAGEFITVTAAEKTYQYSLKQDGIYSVDGESGKTIFEIKKGQVRIKESPCPNKTCIQQGWGKTLVCLPNGVIINVESAGEIDGISQ